MGQIDSNRNYVVIALLSAILSLLTVNKITSLLGLKDFGHDIFLLLLLNCLFLFVVFYIKFPIKRSYIEKNALLFSILCLPALFFSEGYGADTLYGYMSVFSIPLGIAVGKRLCLMYWQVKYKDLFLTIIILPALIGSFLLLTSNMLSLFIENRDFTFSIIIFLPLVYYYRSPIIKYALLFLFAYVVFISTKRTAVLVYALILMLYILSNFDSLKKQGAKKILFAVVLVVISFFVVNQVYQGAERDIFDVTIDRFLNLEDESTDDRNNIYRITEQRLSESSSMEFLLGHGFMAVTRDIFGHPSHNDFLEIAYDYGVIPTIAYFIFLCSLFRYIWQLFRNKGFFGNSLFYVTSAISSYMVLIFLNCIITNTLYMTVLMIVIGWALGYVKLSKYKQLS